MAHVKCIQREERVEYIEEDGEERQGSIDLSSSTCIDLDDAK